jgi:hypothetical protein
MESVIIWDITKIVAKELGNMSILLKIVNSKSHEKGDQTSEEYNHRKSAKI